MVCFNAVTNNSSDMVYAVTVDCTYPPFRNSQGGPPVHD